MNIPDARLPGRPVPAPRTMTDAEFNTAMMNLVGLAVHMPDMLPCANPSEPDATTNPQQPDAAPQGNPTRSPADILGAVKRNLEMALDLASIRLGRLREGTSAWKTQRGLVRGLQEALGALRSEMGS